MPLQRSPTDKDKENDSYNLRSRKPADETPVEQNEPKVAPKPTTALVETPGEARGPENTATPRKITGRRAETIIPQSVPPSSGYVQSLPPGALYGSALLFSQHTKDEMPSKCRRNDLGNALEQPNWPPTVPPPIFLYGPTEQQQYQPQQPSSAGDEARTIPLGAVKKTAKTASNSCNVASTSSNQNTLPAMQSNLVEIVTQVMATMQNLGLSKCNHNYNEKLTINVPIFKDEGTIHPVDFVNRVEHEFKLSGTSFERFKYNLGEKFEGTSLVWSQAFLITFENFQQFKDSFLRQFWSDTKQMDLRLKLQSGKYTDKNGTLVKHFLTYVSMAKHLIPPLSEQLLIATIARHFPPHIASVLVGTVSIEEALERLRQADYFCKKEEPPVTQNPNNAGRIHMAENRVHQNRESAYNYYRRDKNTNTQEHDWKKRNISAVVADIVDNSEGQDSGNEQNFHN